MITVASFSKPEEAYLLKMRLQAGGVEAFVRDEYMVQMNWLYSNAIGGVRVQIHEEDVEDAREILNMVPADSDEPALACPACASVEVTLVETIRITGVLSVLSFLFLAFPLLFLRCGRRYNCDACNHHWRD